MKSIIANGEIEKTLADTGEIKHCQRRQKAGVELQNRCPTTELKWRTDVAIVVVLAVIRMSENPTEKRERSRRRFSYDKSFESRRG